MSITFPMTQFKINPIAFLGSGFYWAFHDALYMSIFFKPWQVETSLAEAFSVSAIVLQAPIILIALLRCDFFQRLLDNKRAVAIACLCGFLGAGSFILGGCLNSLVLLGLGSLASGFYIGVMSMGWGAVYCKNGGKSALLYVSGGFAFAIIVDIPLLFMFPLAAACFYALTPLASCVCFLAMPQQDRTYGLERKIAPEKDEGLVRTAKKYGVSLGAICALALVMMGFGFMQHLTSFSGAPSGMAFPDGIAMQMARGLAALPLFAIALFVPQLTEKLSRLGFLLIIAGYISMTIVYDLGSFWLSGMLFIVGYTMFDITIWVIFCQLGYLGVVRPMKSIAFMRLVRVFANVSGQVFSVLFTFTLVGDVLFLKGVTVVGYLMVIAVVILLGNKKIWKLVTIKAADQSSVAPLTRGFDNLPELFGRLCQNGETLTEREQEIAVFLSQGRTKSWIAKELNVSEHTVNSHARHIYQKMGIHTKQELINLVNRAE